MDSPSSGIFYEENSPNNQDEMYPPRRYMLTYGAQDLVQGMEVTPRPIHQQCCPAYQTWGDPHLSHYVEMMCNNCTLHCKPIGNFPPGNNLMTASYWATDGYENKIHYGACCPLCREVATLRILNRGDQPIQADMPTSVMDLELNGGIFRVNNKVREMPFNLQIKDDTNYMMTNRRDAPENGWEFEMNNPQHQFPNPAVIEGSWENVEWNFPVPQLDINDDFCAMRYRDAVNADRANQEDVDEGEDDEEEGANNNAGGNDDGVDDDM